MTAPKKPEDEGDFLKDLGEVPNDVFRPRREKQTPDPAPQKPQRVQITNDDDEDDFEDFLDDSDIDYDGCYIPVFSLGELDKGEFTDDDLDTMQRLRPFVTCYACNTPGTFCPDMFSHLYELAIWRLSVIGAEIMQIAGGLRERIRVMGADTHDSIDLTILTLAGEMNRIRLLIPKLHAAHEGIDSF